MRNFSILTIMLIACCGALAQKRAQARIIKQSGKNYLVVYGRINLAAGSVPCQLVFSGYQIPFTKSKLTIRKQRFLYRYGPIRGKVLHGEYALRFSWQQQQHQIDFIIGKAEQIWADKHSYIDAIRAIVKDNTDMRSELKKVSAKYLRQQTAKTTVARWLHTIAQRQQQMQEKFEQYQYPQVLAPYLPEIVDNTKRLLHYTQILCSAYRELLSKYYGLRLSPQHHKLFSTQKHRDTNEIQPGMSPSQTRNYIVENLANKRKDAQISKLFTSFHRELAQQKKLYQPGKRAFNLDRHERRISRMVSRICKQLPLPANLDYRQLQKDLLWIDKIYQNLVVLYQQNCRQLLRGTWDNNRRIVHMELKRFQICAMDYRASSLNSYPQLYPSLMGLANSLSALEKRYTKNLYREAGIRIPRKVRKIKLKASALKKSWQINLQNLHTIVNREQKRVQQLQFSLRKRLLEPVVVIEKLLHSLSQDADYRLQNKKDRARQPDAKQQYIELQRTLATLGSNPHIKEYFPRVLPQLELACQNLLTALHQWQHIVRDDHSQMRLQYFKRYRTKVEKCLQRIRRSLQ